MAACLRSRSTASGRAGMAGVSTGYRQAGKAEGGELVECLLTRIGWSEPHLRGLVPGEWSGRLDRQPGISAQAVLVGGPHSAGRRLARSNGRSLPSEAVMGDRAGR